MYINMEMEETKGEEREKGRDRETKKMKLLEL